MARNQYRPVPLSRRQFLGTASAAALSVPSLVSAAPKLQLDGLYAEPWMHKTTDDLGASFAEASRAGKNFAICWELRGCPWCKRLHLETFSRADVAAYLAENFVLFQMNIQSARELADFSGQRLSEEALSYKFGINSTPTIQFFQPSDAARGRELGRAGFLEPERLLPLLRFIREKGYEAGTFEEWAAAHKHPA